jgi:hypothetical protein
MAEQSTPKQGGAPNQPAGQPAQPPPAQTRILWDDTSMRSAYANVANVAGTREEIVLL